MFPRRIALPFIFSIFAIFPCLATATKQELYIKTRRLHHLCYAKPVNTSISAIAISHRNDLKAARLISYPTVIGATWYPDALYRRSVIYCRRNAIGRVKISLSNWMACHRSHSDTIPQRLFRFTRPFSSLPSSRL